MVRYLNGRIHLPLILMSPYLMMVVCRSAMCNIRLAYDLNVMAYWLAHMFDWVVYSLIKDHVSDCLFRLWIYAGAYVCNRSENEWMRRGFFFIFIFGCWLIWFMFSLIQLGLAELRTFRFIYFLWLQYMLHFLMVKIAIFMDR